MLRASTFLKLFDSRHCIVSDAHGECAQLWCAFLKAGEIQTHYGLAPYNFVPHFKKRIEEPFKSQLPIHSSLPALHEDESAYVVNLRQSDCLGISYRLSHGI